jgi:hypothetical protein
MLFTAAVNAAEGEQRMEIDERNLTPRERRYLEHVRSAEERGISLVAYCKERDLNPRALYSTRRDMVHKGMLPRVRAPKGAPKKRDRRKKSSGKFAAVRVATPTLSARADSGVLCRVRHPSGCVLELGEWPEAAWMSKVLQGGGDASA